MNAVIVLVLLISKEVNRQNEIIFDAEKERNALEALRDNLKGLAKLTRKGELQTARDNNQPKAKTEGRGNRPICYPAKQQNTHCNH